MPSERASVCGFRELRAGVRYAQHLQSLTPLASSALGCVDRWRVHCTSSKREDPD